MSTRAATFVVTCLLSVAAQGQEWPQWRGPNRDGHSPDRKLELDWTEKEPELLWMATGTGSGYASVSVANGLIYTTGDKDGAQNVVALNLEGEPVWATPVTGTEPKHGYPGSRCTPTIDGDRCYVVTSDGSIACLNAKDGDIKWQKQFKQWGGKMMSNWGHSESPLIDGEMVLCTPGGPNAMIVALDKVSGEEIWRSAAPKSAGDGKDGAGYASIVIGHAVGVKQYVTLVGRGCIGVRASDGKLLWEYNQVANETANIPTPICYGDYVFCSSGYGGGGTALLKLTEADDGGVDVREEYWLEKRVLQNHHGGMVRSGGYVYLGHGHNKGFPACVELLTGQIVWGGGKMRGLGDGSAAIALVGKNLVFRYQTGEVAIVAATPEGYETRGAIKPAFQQGKSWAHPVICGGKMYLREQDKLMCYQL